MKKVTVRTAQHIAIDFEVASLGVRILSFLLDFSLLVLSCFFLFLLLSAINSLLGYLVLVPLVLYTPACEYLMNGQSLGKRMCKLRVINLYGRAPTLLDLGVRWAFRLVDIWLTVGSLSIILISSTRRSQRLGGLLSNTIVVSTRGELRLTLDDILQLDNRQSYQPKYLEAFRFKEEDMITIKTLLERYEQYRNAAHTRLLRGAARRCAEVLELPEPPADEQLFLRTLLQDYIVITRS